MDRRAFLRAAGSLGALPLAGCAGEGSESPDYVDPNNRVDYTIRCAEGVDRTDEAAGGYRGGSWSTYQGDARNSGYAADASLPEGCPRVRWVWENPGTAQPRMDSQPVVHDGTV